MEFTNKSPPTLGRKVYEHEIPSDIALVPPMVLRVSKFMFDRGWLGTEFQSKLELCLDEAISNAVLHGNESDFSKKVRVSVFVDGSCWRIMVQDEGQGFSPDVIPDPESEEFLWNERGRGFHLINHYMGELAYYDNGSTIVMGRSL